jgi:small-conductance mechanosensitive channel
MEKLEGIFTKIKDFLTYRIYDSDTVHLTVGTFLTIILAIIAVTFILKIIHRIVTAKLPEEDKNKFISIFGFLKYLFYILVIVTILHSSGVNLTVLLTASAALFVGLGFALQYLFQDIISGILIILDQSLHVGDIIEVEDKVGRVFEIRLRTTRALTRDDKVIVIPNHKFLTDSIYNYTQNHKMTREAVKVGVAYGSDVNLVTKILETVAAEQSSVLKNPKPFVLFEDFGDSALLFSLNYYVTDSFSDPKTKSKMRYQIDSRFRENQITIPFPQRDVHLFQNSNIAEH